MTVKGSRNTQSVGMTLWAHLAGSRVARALWTTPARGIQRAGGASHLEEFRCIRPTRNCFCLNSALILRLGNRVGVEPQNTDFNVLSPRKTEGYNVVCCCCSAKLPGRSDDLDDFRNPFEFLVARSYDSVDITWVHSSSAGCGRGCLHNSYASPQEGTYRLREYRQEPMPEAENP